MSKYNKLCWNMQMSHFVAVDISIIITSLDLLKTYLFAKTNAKLKKIHSFCNY